MDVTLDYILYQIYKSSNKKHWRTRKLTKIVNEHISGLRLTARKTRGTSLSSLCNREANYIEKRLHSSLETK